MTGWFVVGDIRSIDTVHSGTGQSELNLSQRYLTPETEPVRLDLSSFLPNGTLLDDLSPRMIVDALTRVFSLEFTGVPKSPINLPLDRLPPSKRADAVAAYEASRPGRIRGSWA